MFSINVFKERKYSIVKAFHNQFGMLIYYIAEILTKSSFLNLKHKKISASIRLKKSDILT